MADTSFPIMFGGYRADEQLREIRNSDSPIVVVAIPWEMIRPHEEQAQRNHGGQSLRRLAERGGLSACEAVAVLEDRRFASMKTASAMKRLYDLLRAWHAQTPASGEVANG